VRKTTVVVVALTLVLTIISPRNLRAQALADRIPADSFVYFGWKGTDTPDNGYKGSHLQAVFEASDAASHADGGEE
jgi:hypothetical protein